MRVVQLKLVLVAWTLELTCVFSWNVSPWMVTGWLTRLLPV